MRIPRRRSIDAELRRAFDEAWYRRTYGLDESVADAWGHYLTVGTECGFDPAPWFSASDYLTAHPDVREGAREPFTHYVLTGCHENRSIQVSRHSWPAAASDPVALLRQRSSRDGGEGKRRRARSVDWQAVAANLVDARFYEAVNPDVPWAQRSPAEHFMNGGWRDGRDPNRWFSTAFYLECNPDVRAADVNPLVHYLSTGRGEGRLAYDPLGFDRHIIMKKRSVEIEGREWLATGPALLLSETAALERIDGAVASLGMNRLAVVVGNDDYASGVGGVQACMSVEVQELAEESIAALYVFPIKPLPHLSLQDDPVVRLRVGERLLGDVPVSTLCALLAELSRRDRLLDTLTVHGLLGHSLRWIVQSAGGSDRLFTRVVFWAHDYFAACPTYTLAPTGLDFCGAPDSRSARCIVCPAGSLRQRHQQEFADFLRLEGVAVQAPSAAAAECWTNAVGYRGEVTVRPIGSLTWEGERKRSLDSQRLRVAFIGYPAAHKGWAAFLDVHRWTAGDDELDLLVLGAEAVRLPGVEFVDVRQTGGQTSAMVDALRKHHVDAVLHWPSWPEAFGITAHEALAAGCAVVTNRSAGHVTAMADQYDQVWTLDGEELGALLRRRQFASWMRMRMTSGAEWGTFSLGGISVVAECERNARSVRL